MFATLHGAFAPDTEPRTRAAADLYSLFHARSRTMGLLSGLSPNDSGNSWGMNDALGASGSENRVASVQVVNTGTGMVGRPAPVQAFLVCVRDAVERMGALDVDAVQVVVPAHRRTGVTLRERMAVAGDLLSTASWFPDSAGLRSPVQITLDVENGTDQLAAEIVAWCSGIRQDMIDLGDGSAAGSEALALQPEVEDLLRTVPTRRRITWSGKLCEWSIDAIGWSAAFLVDAAVQHDVTGPVVVSIRKR